MSYDSCPNCGSSEGGAVYKCSNEDCEGYGHMYEPIPMMGYIGCWTDSECPHCGEKGTKEYQGRIIS